MIRRACLRCGAEIQRCDGFALIRDWGRREPIREHCGWCVEWLEMLSDGQRRDYLLSLGGLDNGAAQTPG